MYRLLITLIVIVATAPAFAQQQPIPFVTFVIDQAKYNQIDDLISKLSMPRDAHIALQRMLQSLEQEAIETAKIKASK